MVKGVPRCLCTAVLESNNQSGLEEIRSSRRAETFNSQIAKASDYIPKEICPTGEDLGYIYDN